MDDDHAIGVSSETQRDEQVRGSLPSDFHPSAVVEPNLFPNDNRRRISASNVSDRSGWTSFEADVAAVLDRLAEGDVVTYGEVAAEAGYPGAARAVGSLLSRLPDAGLCWWRVVTTTGRLAPNCELEQAKRLRAEGVEVVDGRVRGLSR